MRNAVQRRVALITVALLATAAAGCSSESSSRATTQSVSAASSSGGIVTVSAEAFRTAIADPGVIVLDVRTPEEYAAGHIAGAVNVNFNDASFDAQLQSLDREAAYAIYCQSSNRSGQAVAKMRELGFTTITELADGIVSWANAGYPIES